MYKNVLLYYKILINKNKSLTIYNKVYLIGIRTFRRIRFAEFHFAEAVSPNGRFAEWTFRRTDVSPNGHFAERTFRRTDVSPNGRFAESVSPKDISPKFGLCY